MGVVAPRNSPEGCAATIAERAPHEASTAPGGRLGDSLARASTRQGAMTGQ
eukprot:CAMPEP_0168472912 /NCGR_PEP_ID=MMETSP0228-20121227/60047_1 /TAXON_ID=133427 /ORGANISM="Protoceratium reticulatum, Strain CCCM 535 (=CCMP 1889)" /LENGTH=50 /DNA_ID=CAMNT_0008488877 /DNA_START=127 /DNA_END=276 /DNA_ORIENTATION=+